MPDFIGGICKVRFVRGLALKGAEKKFFKFKLNLNFVWYIVPRAQTTGGEQTK